MTKLLVQWQHLLDDVPIYFLLVLQRAMLLDQILLPALWYCTGVLLVVGNICFLYNGNGGVASLGLLMFWCIFLLSLLMSDLSGLDWEVLCYLSLDPPSGSTLGGGDVWYSTLGSLELLLISGAGRFGSATLFGILVSASKIFANSLITLRWEFTTWKYDYGLGVYKSFAVSEASWIAISLAM